MGLTEIEQEVSKYPVSVGMKDAELSKPLHFEIPDYNISLIKEDDLPLKGLKMWRFYRELANVACFSMLTHLQSESEIRIWPHHFDTGIFVQFNNSLGLGFGLAMKDSLLEEPYFYLAGYASNNPIKYINQSKLFVGKWINNEQWNGAVLPISELGVFNTGNTLEKIKLFINESNSWFLTQKQ